MVADVICSIRLDVRCPTGSRAAQRPRLDLSSTRQSSDLKGAFRAGGAREVPARLFLQGQATKTRNSADVRFRSFVARHRISPIACAKPTWRGVIRVGAAGQPGISGGGQSRHRCSSDSVKKNDSISLCLTSWLPHFFLGSSRPGFLSGTVNANRFGMPRLEYSRNSSETGMSCCLLLTIQPLGQRFPPLSIRLRLYSMTAPRP